MQSTGLRVESYWTPQELGEENGNRVRDTYAVLEADIWGIGAMVLTEQQINDLRRGYATRQSQLKQARIGIQRDVAYTGVCLGSGLGTTQRQPNVAGVCAELQPIRFLAGTGR